MPCRRRLNGGALRRTGHALTPKTAIRVNYSALVRRSIGCDVSHACYVTSCLRAGSGARVLASIAGVQGPYVS